jgi:hypothetical protein
VRRRLALAAASGSLGVGVEGASNVVIEGFEVRNFDKTQSSTGIDVDGGADCTVASNMLHDIYYANDPVPGGTAWEQQFGTGISVTNSPGTNVTGNYVRDCGNAGTSGASPSRTTTSTTSTSTTSATRGTATASSSSPAPTTAR